LLSTAASSSSAQRIAFDVPLAEMVGVAPGKPNTTLPLSVGVIESIPFVTVKALITSEMPQK
jgi:hypothetical protein